MNSTKKAFDRLLDSAKEDFSDVAQTYIDNLIILEDNGVFNLGNYADFGLEEKNKEDKPFVIATELFKALTIIKSSNYVLNSLSSKILSEQAKKDAIDSLFDEFSEETRRVLYEISLQSYVKESALLDRIEYVAIDCILKNALYNGLLEQIESEVFVFSQVLASSSLVRDALSFEQSPYEFISDSIDLLIDGRFGKLTVLLLKSITINQTSKHYYEMVLILLHRIYQVMYKVVVHIKTAVPLSESQKDRLEKYISNYLDRYVQMNIAVDRSLVGGMVVSIGNNVVDMTVNRQIEALRSTFK